MNSKFKLTIAVITMNRAKQLLEALESCVLSKLPEDTEFVIVDNASTDDTKKVAEQFSSKISNVRYEYLHENLGVGGGRSYAFEMAQGEYVYFLDDDAVISDESKDTFFTDTLNYLDKNKNVASLTTRIYDEMLIYNREVDVSEKTKIDGLPIVFKYLGGSHFLRRSCFETPLYFDIKYGSEEYAPSIRVQDNGYFHVYDNHVVIIHKPKVNKWVDGTQEKENILCCSTANIYATKRVLYPKIFALVLYMGFYRRCLKNLKQYPGAKKRTLKMAKDVIKNNNAKRISFKTVIKLLKEFGITVL